MNEAERNSGSEILEGLKETKRGEHGRIINWEFRCERSRSGNTAVEVHRVQLGLC